MFGGWGQENKYKPLKHEIATLETLMGDLKRMITSCGYKPVVAQKVSSSLKNQT